MSDIKDTLKERKNKYGSFSDNAVLTQELMKLIEAKTELPNEYKEAFHMIFHKIARLVCGDLYHQDSIHDVIGYASLLEDFIIQHNKKTKGSPYLDKERFENTAVDADSYHIKRWFDSNEKYINTISELNEGFLNVKS